MSAPTTTMAMMIWTTCDSEPPRRPAIGLSLMVAASHARYPSNRAGGGRLAATARSALGRRPDDEPFPGAHCRDEAPQHDIRHEQPEREGKRDGEARREHIERHQSDHCERREASERAQLLSDAYFTCTC